MTKLTGQVRRLKSETGHSEVIPMLAEQLKGGNDSLEALLVLRATLSEEEQQSIEKADKAALQSISSIPY